MTVGDLGRVELNRRLFLAFSGLGVTATVLSSCGKSDNAGSGEGGEKQGLRVIMAGQDNPGYNHHMVYCVAKEQGFLDEAGFTGADFEPPLVMSEALAAVIGGGVEWSAIDSDAVIPAIVDHDVPLVWLGTNHDKEDLLLGLAPGVTIEKLRKEGGTVSGGEPGARNSVLVRKMLTELDVPLDNIEFLNIGGGSDTRVQALIQGSLDASNLQLRHTLVMDQAGGTVAYQDKRSCPQDGFSVRQDFLQEYSDEIAAYMYALVLAKQFIKDAANKDAVLEAARVNGFETLDEFPGAYEADVDNLSADNGFEVPEMEIIWPEVAEGGEVSADIDWRSALDLRPLWDAQEQAGLPRRPAQL